MAVTCKHQIASIDNPSCYLCYLESKNIDKTSTVITVTGGSYMKEIEELKKEIEILKKSYEFLQARQCEVEGVVKTGELMRRLHKESIEKIKNPKLMDFGEALKAMKEGKRVKRKNWEDTYIYIDNFICDQYGMDGNYALSFNNMMENDWIIKD